MKSKHGGNIKGTVSVCHTFMHTCAFHVFDAMRSLFDAFYMSSLGTRHARHALYHLFRVGYIALPGMRGLLLLLWHAGVGLQLVLEGRCLLGSL